MNVKSLCLKEWPFNIGSKWVQENCLIGAEKKSTALIATQKKEHTPPLVTMEERSTPAKYTQMQLVYNSLYLVV